MKIVITDAITVSNGDIDLNMFSKYGEVVSYDVSYGDDIAPRVKDADIILCNKTILGEKELKDAKNLKLIALFATGYNIIDTEYCTKRGICVCNAGTYSTDSVAQHAFALILEHFSRVGDYNKFVHDGGWFDSPSFSPFIFPTDEIAGKTIGIVGLGSIGQTVAKISNAFGMKVIANTRTPKNIDGVEEVTYDELLSRSDIISFHCPLTDFTRGMFGKDEIAKCKDGAFVVNTSRGPVIDEEALCEALTNGKFSGAGVDVIEREPMQKDCKLFPAPNLIITPHVAWAPYTTRVRLCGIVCDTIEAFLAGTPKNKVN